MNSKAWWIVLVVIVIIVGIIMFMKSGASDTEVDDVTVTDGGSETSEVPSGTATTPEKTPEGYFVVRYKAGGFSPASLEVALGDSVRFTNDSNDAMSIAPADTVNQPYATFDQTKSIGKGESYNYTFTTIGSYTYYNLNNKEHVGTVTAK